jgi:hypothetical protein
MTNWVNNDGLKVRFGTEEVEVTQGGSFRNNDLEMVHELDVSLTDLTTGTAISDLEVYDNVVIPEGHIVSKVEIYTQVAATSGGSAALNVGLVATDYTTITDSDGLVNALALTSIDAAGETTTVVAGDTAAGALMGTALASAGVLSVDVDSAVYTAGRLRIRVYTIAA